METAGTPALWIGFAVVITVMLVLDLGVFHRKAHKVETREALAWSGIWIVLALAFNLVVWLRLGSETGTAFLTGYLIEKALSVDNLFVFYAIFTAFRVPAEYQHRLLFWGILGAIVSRTAMVIGGTVLLATFHAVVYVFGAILIWSGLKMLRRRHEEPHPEQGRLFRFLRRIIPTTQNLHGQRMFTRLEKGALRATPLFLVLVLIELTDVVFAIDSILAIFAVTTDPFIVITSNIFAVLGLRALYFVLAAAARRFHYLQPGLALILVFVGIKMALSEVAKIPVLLSLAVVSVLLGGSILASMVRNWRRRRRGEEPVIAPLASEGSADPR